MYGQSPRSRGQRSNKGFKVKHGLQLILILGVVIWLLYQTQRSYNHNEDKSLSQGANVSESLRLGRKDLPDFGDTEMRTREKEEVKKVGDEGTKSEEDEKTRSGEMKSVEKDGRIESLSLPNEMQDGSDNDEKVMGKKQNKDNNESTESVDFSEDKQANINTFSDETFAARSQNETDDNPGAKIEKGETGSDSYQSDLNADPMLKTGDSGGVEGGDSTAFSDTNGNEEANGVEIPRPSTSGTNEKSESEHPDTSPSSSSQEQKANNIKEPSRIEQVSSTERKINKHRWQCK